MALLEEVRAGSRPAGFHKLPLLIFPRGYISGTETYGALRGKPSLRAKIACLNVS
jgi:hypothetical protein